MLAVRTSASQELVRDFVDGDFPQDFPGQHVGREQYRAGDHQLRQWHTVVLGEIRVEGLERVIPRDISPRDFINVHHFIVVLLPSGQYPVGAEQVRDAVLTAAQQHRTPPHGNRQIMIEGIRAAHQAGFVDETFEPESGVVHLLQPAWGPEDFPGGIEYGRATFLPPDFHLPQIPLVGVA